MLVGELVDLVNNHFRNCDEASGDVVTAWADLLEVFETVVTLLEKKPGKISICAWCRKPAEDLAAVREHIKVCEYRKRDEEMSDALEDQS